MRYEIKIEKPVNIDSLIAEPLNKKAQVENGVRYACSNLQIENPLELKCKIIVTDDYKSKRDHYVSIPSPNIPNGETIPPIIQSANYKKSVVNNVEYFDKTIILINDEKIQSDPHYIFESVVVHEVSHCADYTFKLEEFQDRYNVVFGANPANTLGNVLIGYFEAFSEVRAKYLQEKYIIQSMDFNNIISHLVIDKLNQYDKNNEQDLLYWMQHCAGQLRCWEELLVKKPIYNNFEEGRKRVEDLREYYLEKYQYHDVLHDMYKLWDWNHLLEKCDNLYEKNGKNLNAPLV